MSDMFKLEIFENIKIEKIKNEIIFIGRLGKSNFIIPNNMEITIKNNFLIYKLSNKNLNNLYLKLFKNKIKGITQGFKRIIYLKGVGYKWMINKTNDYLILELGFSHQIFLKIPEDIKLNITNKSTKLIIIGVDLQKLTQFVYKIRSYKKPEPYKGKGILLKNEKILKKEGKKSKK